MRFIFSGLSKRERHILYIVIVVITAAFFDRVVLRQIMNRLNKLNREILTYQRRLQHFLYVSSQEKEIIKEHERYTQHVKQSYSDGEEKSQLLSEIEKLARKSSVFLADIKPGSVTKFGSYKEYTVEIETESEISSLVDFIYQLERSPRLLRVKSFRITPKKKDSATLKAWMTVTVAVVGSGLDS